MTTDTPTTAETDTPAVTTETVAVTSADDSTASAEVTTASEAHHTATVQFDSGTRRLPAVTRRELVDAVMDHPGVSASDELDAVVPRSDTDTIIRLQQRTTDFQARAAGVTSIVHAEIPHAEIPHAE